MTPIGPIDGDKLVEFLKDTARRTVAAHAGAYSYIIGEIENQQFPWPYPSQDKCAYIDQSSVIQEECGLPKNNYRHGMGIGMHPFVPSKEPRKWKPDEKFKADYADFGRGQVPAVFFPDGCENFLVTSEDQAKLVARLLNEWLAKSALNASEERDFTPQEAYEEARKRYGESGWVLVTDEEPGKLIYKVGNHTTELTGRSWVSFRAAFASADAAKEEKK